MKNNNMAGYKTKQKKLIFQGIKRIRKLNDCRKAKYVSRSNNNVAPRNTVYSKIITNNK